MVIHANNQSSSGVVLLQELGLSPHEVLNDYRIACESRAASVLGRKEVFSGKAKFGIFGDGKEVAQLAMAKVFQQGDFRSGYYRDQTFMLAIGSLTIQQYFAQLYAHASTTADPASGGRMMNCHFATRMLDAIGQWKNLLEYKNSTADVSCNGAQMPRLLGLAYASKLYRIEPFCKVQNQFSHNGNEVAFGTIGNAATSEGMFFETINAAGVLQVPMCISIWDDGYGISVPNKYHTTKESISQVLSGFQKTATQKGLEIFSVKGWDYVSLCKIYRHAVQICRKEHVPVILHIQEMTQPQGHSTSGSHERYKSKERLQWEAEHDCILKMKEWLLYEKIATAVQLESIENESYKFVKKQQEKSWNAFIAENQEERNHVIQLLCNLLPLKQQNENEEALNTIITTLEKIPYPTRLHTTKAAQQALYHLVETPYIMKKKLIAWVQENKKNNEQRFSDHLYSKSLQAALQVPVIAPVIEKGAVQVDGREVLRACFNEILRRDPRVFAIGQDLGKLGDVNQTFAGLQQEYGVLRVTDTGIRECTMLGQGIGAALRGLKPIVEIQYLDYLLYALQIMSDDLATLRYRTGGGQKAPMIIRTRGHRLEGIWHSGSYMGGIIHNVRGIYVAVPRNMTQAAGFYNTMVQSDDPALIIECLNGYRLKECMPSNISTMTVPLGVPEILKEGTDVTIVTYGAMCRIIMETVVILERLEVSCEVIDVQTLLPFDRFHIIGTSLKKTNHIVFADEDVPGGVTAYMMQQVLEIQGGYYYLDAAPVTITSKEHRPAYGDDGNYFSKPNVELILEKIYNMMSALYPLKYPPLF